MTIKAREVRERLKGKVDPDVSVVLEAMAEEQYQIGKQLTEMANGLNQVIDTLSNITNVVGHNQEVVAKLKKRIGDDEYDV